MTFTDGYRVERVYFERLKSLITILKSLKDGVEDETVRTLIENAIDSDGAILLLYRNLGEAWAELADQVQKTRKMLQDLDEKTEKYHDELNERIDEVNNYLMALIRALEARMDAVEADLAQMGRLFTYDLNRVNDEYTLTESGQPVTWTGTVEKVQHVRPHFVTVRGSLDGEVTYLMPREYDTAQASGIFEWYSVGFVGNEIHEVTVTLLPDDSVNVAIHTTDFASILQRISNLETRMTTAESDIDNLETRMTTAETDIDNLETEMDGKQDVLTPGTGIDITNNVISADTDVLQEKLVAGSGISIDPVTKEITNTAQGTTYTAGAGIVIENDAIIADIRDIAVERNAKPLKAGTEVRTPVTEGNIKVYNYNLAGGEVTKFYNLIGAHLSRGGAEKVQLTTQPSTDHRYKIRFYAQSVCTYQLPGAPSKDYFYTTMSDEIDYFEKAGRYSYYYTPSRGMSSNESGYGVQRWECVEALKKDPANPVTFGWHGAICVLIEDLDTATFVQPTITIQEIIDKVINLSLYYHWDYRYNDLNPT